MIVALDGDDEVACAYLDGIEIGGSGHFDAWTDAARDVAIEGDLPAELVNGGIVVASAIGPSAVRRQYLDSGVDQTTRTACAPTAVITSARFDGASDVLERTDVLVPTESAWSFGDATPGEIASISYGRALREVSVGIGRGDTGEPDAVVAAVEWWSEDTVWRWTIVGPDGALSLPRLPADATGFDDVASGEPRSVSVVLQSFDDESWDDVRQRPQWELTAPVDDVLSGRDGPAIPHASVSSTIVP
jgi:hypothetical protein